MPLGGWAFDDGSDSDGGTGDAMVLETGGRAAAGSSGTCASSLTATTRARTTIKALWNFMVKQLNQKKMSLTVEEMFVKGNTRKTNIYSTAPDFICFANYMR